MRPRPQTAHDQELLKWFSANAVFNPRAPEHSRYSVYITEIGRNIYASDTAELFRKLKEVLERGFE